MKMIFPPLTWRELLWQQTMCLKYLFIISTETIQLLFLLHFLGPSLKLEPQWGLAWGIFYQQPGNCAVATIDVLLLKRQIWNTTSTRRIGLIGNAEENKEIWYWRALALAWGVWVVSNQRKSRPEEGATQKIPQNDLQFGFECCELLLVKVKKKMFVWCSGSPVAHVDVKSSCWS